MQAQSDYARIVDLLTEQQLAPYVSYVAHDRIDGMADKHQRDHIVVRVHDGKIVGGHSHFHLQTNGAYDTSDLDPVAHPAFVPGCYRATGERATSFDGKPAIAMSLVATCKSKHKGDHDYPFTTLYADPATMHPLDVNGTVPQTRDDKFVSVSLDQRFGEYSGRVLPSAFKLDVSGSGLMFWLQIHLTESYSDYRFLTSYRG